MASTFSPSLRLELIGDGDQSGIWGQTTNNNLGTLLEQAVAGVITINIADANYTLTNFNGVADEARNAVITITGTLSQQRNIIAPLADKVFTFRNSTTGGFSIQVIGSSGTGVIIPNGATTSVYCDGTNFLPLNTGAAGNFSVSGNLSVTGTTTLTGALAGSTATFSGAVNSTNSVLSGTPAATTATAGDNTTRIATTAFVTGAVTAATGSLGTMSTQNANNVAITGGTINGVTGTAAGLTVGTATNATNATTATTATNANQFQGKTKLGLGITGEVWNDVTGSRSSGTTYTAPAYPIMVVVASAPQFQSHSVVIVVGGVTVSNSGGGGNFYLGGQDTSFIVPPGLTYSVTFNNCGLQTWAELY
jgi:hypothetical protein